MGKHGRSRSPPTRASPPRRQGAGAQREPADSHDGRRSTGGAHRPTETHGRRRGREHTGDEQPRASAEGGRCDGTATSTGDRRQPDSERVRSRGADGKAKLYRPDSDEQTADSERKRARSDHARRPPLGNKGGEEKYEWGKPESDKPPLTGANADEEPAQEKQKPSLALSGKLAAETNTFNGVVVKYSEPVEARKPKVKWRLYPFKGDESLPVLYVHRQSAYLFGRDRHVCDVAVDHPSCSKQHAVLQYRSLRYTRSDGAPGRRTLPYIIDLGSANGTQLNGEKIESARYYELHERDVLKFAFSTREYVVLNEHSVANDNDDHDDEAAGSHVKQEV